MDPRQGAVKAIPTLPEGVDFGPDELGTHHVSPERKPIPFTDLPG
jgi:hypothetical protein